MLDVKDLNIEFHDHLVPETVVHQVSFHMDAGEIVGLVGESGCGKTTFGRTVLQLYNPTSGKIIYDGETIFEGQDPWKRDENGILHPVKVPKVKQVNMLPYRRKMQIIFQDPYSSLSPRLPIGEIIGEAVREHGLVPKEQFDDYITKVMKDCGLQEYHKDRYPHEFSGGQRQRICIARALALNPEFIVCDEPVSALDVSIQAQVINLLNDLRNKMGLTIMFIAHNLSVVKYFSDRIGVMYYGKLVELADSDELFEHPLHPYTKSLLSAIPYPDPHHEKHRQRIEYKPLKEHDYSVNKPSLREIKPGHFINCNDEEFERYKKELGL